MVTEDKNRRRRKKLVELSEKILGNVEELSDEELEELCSQVAPELDVRESMRAVAQQAATAFRLCGEKVPHHVKALLDSTKEQSIQDTPPSQLMKLVDKYLAPTISTKSRVAFSFRQRPGQELSEKDRQLLKDIEKELQEDEQDEG